MNAPDMADTIVARSTPAGKSAICVLRLSGPGSKRVMAKAVEGDIALVVDRPRHMQRTWLIDDKGRRIDDALVVFFGAPNSYTGQDMMEVHCHGGRKVANMVIERLIQAGARSARPGEFTFRAFENGKMDLSRAESVAHMVEARTRAEVLGAGRALAGEFGSLLDTTRDQLMEAMSRMEASIDFPAEPDVADSVSGLAEGLDGLLVRIHDMRGQTRKVLASDAEVVFCGRANVGKSSLVNRILDDEVSIVTPEAGTTRDAVRAELDLRGLRVGLVDTAGISSQRPAGLAAKKASDVARERIARATLAVWVSEVGMREEPETPSDVEVIEVVNKSDLLDAGDGLGIGGKEGDGPVLLTSALTGDGVAELVEQIGKRLAVILGPADGIPMTSRQAETLAGLEKSVTRAYRAVSEDMAELAVEDLRVAIESVDRLTGRQVDDDILDRIFSRFCIGK